MRISLVALGAVALGAAVAALVVLKVGRRGQSGGMGSPQLLSPAPPSTADGTLVGALPDAPAGALVFDLQYRARTGARGEAKYNSFWGFGGSDAEAKANPFVQAVQKKARNLHHVNNMMLPGRPWSLVECSGREFVALYFDLNANGAFEESERIPPTVKTGPEVEFITPDFKVQADGDREAVTRVLLRAHFYSGNQEPNFMWSPAAMLEGKTVAEGKPARMLLFTSDFGKSFDRFGSTSCALFLGEEQTDPEVYIPRETLSSLVRFGGQFYRLKLEGRRADGHVARAILTKDTTPRGTLALRMAGAQPLQSGLASLSLQGVDDATIRFRTDQTTDPFPVGGYELTDGGVSYGQKEPREWEVRFAKGPRAILEAGKRTEVVLGEPTLAVRAIDEKDRYSPQAKESTVFDKGASIYLEPRVTGKAKEVFTRFHRPGANGTPGTDVQPQLTIKAPDGKEILSKSMEYG